MVLYSEVVPNMMGAKGKFIFVAGIPAVFAPGRDGGKKGGRESPKAREKKREDYDAFFLHTHRIGGELWDTAVLGGMQYGAIDCFIGKGGCDGRANRFGVCRYHHLPTSFLFGGNHAPLFFSCGSKGRPIYHSPLLG